MVTGAITGLMKITSTHGTTTLSMRNPFPRMVIVKRPSVELCKDLELGVQKNLVCPKHRVVIAVADDGDEHVDAQQEYDDHVHHKQNEGEVRDRLRRVVEPFHLEIAHRHAEECEKRTTDCAERALFFIFVVLVRSSPEKRTRSTDAKVARTMTRMHMKARMSRKILKSAITYRANLGPSAGSR